MKSPGINGRRKVHRLLPLLLIYPSDQTPVLPLCPEGTLNVCGTRKTHVGFH